MAAHANITRRAALSSMTATLLAAPALSAAQANEERHPDAALLILGERMDRLWAEEQRLLVLSQMNESDDALSDAWQATFDGVNETVNTIAALPALTFEGLRVKARGILWIADGDVNEIDPGYENQNTTDKRLAKSIIVSLLQL